MSQETKHTPGPWRVYYNGSYGPFVETEKTNDPDYGTADHANGHETHAIAAPSGPSARANARLIAAAPELLEALRIAGQLIQDIRALSSEVEGLSKERCPQLPVECRKYAQDAERKITAAIAKATGESA